MRRARLLVSVAVVWAAGCASFGGDESTDAAGGVDAATDGVVDGAIPRSDAGDPGDAGSDAYVEAGTVGCLGVQACQRLVFVTSAAYQATVVVDVLGADLTCAMLADAPSALPVLRGRTWRAWLSSSTEAVTTRLVHGTMPYVLTSGVVIAKHWTDLTDGAIQAGIALDEKGATQSGPVWTGTSSSGTLVLPDCNRWSLSGASLMGTAGVIGTGGTNWTTANQIGCQQTARLYCFEN